MNDPLWVDEELCNGKVWTAVLTIQNTDIPDNELDHDGDGFVRSASMCPLDNGPEKISLGRRL